MAERERKMIEEIITISLIRMVNLEALKVSERASTEVLVSTTCISLFASFIIQFSKSYLLSRYFFLLTLGSKV